MRKYQQKVFVTILVMTFLGIPAPLHAIEPTGFEIVPRDSCEPHGLAKKFSNLLSYVRAKISPASVPLPEAPEIDFRSIAQSILKARRQTRNREAPLRFFELRDTARWMEISLDHLLETANKTIKAAENRNRVKSESKLLRSKLREYLNAPTAIELSDWIEISERYANFVRACHEGESFKLPVSSTLKQDILKNFVKNKNGYVVIPTAEKLSVEKINEWQSVGLVPLQVHSSHPANVSEVELFNWQKKHFKRIGTRNTRITLEPHEYFSRFQKFRDDFASYPTMTKILDVLWYDVYFESFGREYGPHEIINVFRYPSKSQLERLNARLRVEFSGVPPTGEQVTQALNRLVEFAEKIELKYRDHRF